MIMLDKIKSLKGKLPALPNKQKDQSDYLVGLDIGTEYVKALIARVNEDGSADIIGVGRVHQDLNDMQAGAIADIAAVVANCDKALATAEKQAGVSARSAVIGIAGELVKGTTTTVVFARKTPEKELDVAEVERIVGIVQSRAEKQAKKQLAWELGGKNVDVKLVNSALVSILIDGYPVTNPVGFQGREVKVQLYTAFAPLVHIGALERTAQQLDLDLLAVAAEPFAVARSVIGNDTNATLSAILVDVGGGTTDIAVVNEGGVEGTKMFGIGGRAFTKSVARDLGIEFDEAELVKLSMSKEHIETQKSRAAELALDKTLDVWLNGVELALGEFTKLDHLPERLLLCGGGSSLKLLPEILKSDDWYKDLPFTKRPVVQLMTPDQVIGIIDTTGKVADHTFITAMGLIRVGLDTMNTDTKSSKSLRDRLNKLLNT